MSEKKNVTSTSGSVTVASTMWLMSRGNVHRSKSRMDRVVNIAMQRVMQDVADQEQRREHERRDHRRAMGRNAPRADEREPDQQRRRAQPVQHRIERRQKREPHAGRYRSRMNIDQPEQEQRGRGADGEDGGNRRAGAGLLAGDGATVVILSLVLRNRAQHQRGHQQRQIDHAHLEQIARQRAAQLG